MLLKKIILILNSSLFCFRKVIRQPNCKLLAMPCLNIVYSKGWVHESKKTFGICLFSISLLFHTYSLNAGNAIETYQNKSIKINRDIVKYFSNKPYTLNVFLYTDTFNSFENNYPLLIKLLSNMGIDTVYLAFNNKRFTYSEKYSKNIRSFISLAHKNKIKVSALIYNDIYPYFDKDYRHAVINNLKKYFVKCRLNEKFDSITSDLEPNTIRKNLSNIPASFNLRWDKKNGWGKNGDNNKLLTLTLKLLHDLKEQFPEISISQTTQFYFDNYVNKGLLTIGSSNDFLKICDNIIIMCYFDNLNDITKYSRKTVKDTIKSNSVVIAIKTTDKGNPRTTLAGSNISNFAEILKNISLKSSKFSSFNGIAVYDLQGLLKILLTR